VYNFCKENLGNIFFFRNHTEKKESFSNTLCHHYFSKFKEHIVIVLKIRATAYAQRCVHVLGVWGKWCCIYTSLLTVKRLSLQEIEKVDA